MCGHAFLCPCHARALRAACDWFAFATCGVCPGHNGNGHERVADCLDCAIVSSARSLRA